MANQNFPGNPYAGRQSLEITSDAEAVANLDRRSPITQPRMDGRLRALDYDAWADL